MVYCLDKRPQKKKRIEIENLEITERSYQKKKRKNIQMRIKEDGVRKSPKENLNETEVLVTKGVAHRNLQQKKKTKNNSDPSVDFKTI